MARVGEDNAWRESLGEERKNIGDFACYVHCFVSLAGR